MSRNRSNECIIDYEKLKVLCQERNKSRKDFIDISDDHPDRQFRISKGTWDRIKAGKKVRINILHNIAALLALDDAMDLVRATPSTLKKTVAPPRPTSNLIYEVIRNQTRRLIGELRGDFSTTDNLNLARYVDTLYEPRVDGEHQLELYFQNGQDRIFCVHADSGFGKTNLAVSWTQKLLAKDTPVFFIQASRITHGDLVAFLSSTFGTSGEQRLFDSLIDLKTKSEDPFTLVVDGLEWADDRLELRKSLIHFIDKCESHIPKIDYRILVTCRTPAWELWTSDGELGQILTDKVTTIHSVSTPINSNQPGYPLGPFTYEELSRAFDRYTKYLNLDVKHLQELRILCDRPIMLRFIADMCKDKANQEFFRTNTTPTNILVLMQFLVHTERRTGAPMVAQSILEKIASTFILKGVTELPYHDVLNCINIHDPHAHVFEKLLKESILVQQTHLLRASVSFYSDLILETVVARALLNNSTSFSDKGVLWLTEQTLTTGMRALLLGIARQCVHLSAYASDHMENILLHLWHAGDPWRNIVAQEFFYSVNSCEWANRIRDTGEDVLLQSAASSVCKIARIFNAEDIARLCLNLEPPDGGSFWVRNYFDIARKRAGLKQSLSKAPETIFIGSLKWPAYGLFEYAVQQFNKQPHGYRFEIIDIANTSEKCSALKEGRIELMLGTLDEAVILAAEGNKPAILAVIAESKGADALIASTNWSNIDEVLKKARIAVEETGPGHFFVSQLARLHAVSADSLRKRIINREVHDPCKELVTGMVDAVGVWDPWLTKLGSEYHSGVRFSTREVDRSLLIDTLIGIDGRLPEEDVCRSIVLAWHRTLAEYQSRARTKIVVSWLSEYLDVDQELAIKMLANVQIHPGINENGYARSIDWLNEIWLECAAVWQYAGVIKEIPDGHLAVSHLIDPTK